MATKISAAERPIREVFSDQYRFSIPRYQRPYAWTTEQAGELLSDLAEAAHCEHKLENTDPYFLGSVVLVKEEDKTLAEVVDGQQRLTTLTVLFSALRMYVPANFVDPLNNLLHQRGDALVGTDSQPRLSLRNQDQSFLEKHILDDAGLRDLRQVAPGLLSDSQRNLRTNALLFQDRLARFTEDECKRLASFVAANTFLVVVSTQDFDSAYRIFTVLNERGLDLTHSDILKAEIIGGIPEDAQAAYTATWEREEEDLGRAAFADLFAHIRMVYAKTKARETILSGFRSAVLARVPDKRQFINDVLVPMSDAYEVVLRTDYRAGDDPAAVNQLLAWLNRLDNTDWIPPAINFLSLYGGDPQKVRTFLMDLDRLAASMYIRRVDVTSRIERYGKVLGAIERGADLDAPLSPLQLSAEERAGTLARLDGDVYGVLRTRLYVLLRLDHVLSSGGASYDYPVITVEHVLPQNPTVVSAWRRAFTDEERAYWVNRLANLVLLTRRKNSAAGNQDFGAKKTGYFAGTGGVSPFVLTTQVLTERTWTPDVLRRRQRILLGALKDLWRL